MPKGKRSQKQGSWQQNPEARHKNGTYSLRKTHIIGAQTLGEKGETNCRCDTEKETVKRRDWITEPERSKSSENLTGGKVATPNPNTKKPAAIEPETHRRALTGQRDQHRNNILHFCSP